MDPRRDHIFISYATEQWPLCDWLARRLAVEGYAIWCDRQKLLGGENWPNDIDLAIKERTFRMVALLSRASLAKPNPQGEWLKGFAVGKKIGIDDFVIPLNTEGLRSDDITWNLQPINYISFAPSWANGLKALLKKLASIDAPRVLQDGPRIATTSIVNECTVRNKPEILVSNCFDVIQIPRFICQYIVKSRKLPRRVIRRIQREWACRDVSSRRILAFSHPPTTVKERYYLQNVGRVSWRSVRSICNIDSRVLVVSLIYKSLAHLLRTKGMSYCSFAKQWYLPRGLLENNRVVYRLPDGKKSWFKGASQRTYYSAGTREIYRYHLSFALKVTHDHGNSWILSLRNRVYLTDADGNRLEQRKVQSRRKHLCKTWFNREWCARTLGAIQLLADGDKSIRVGPEGKQQLVINAVPIALDVPKCIDDQIINELNQTDVARNEIVGVAGEDNEKDRPDSDDE